MNREEIIRIAREAGLVLTCDVQDAYIRDGQYGAQLERFAALVAAAEREACCFGEVLNAANINGGDHPHQVIEKYQAAIRARGQK